MDVGWIIHESCELIEREKASGLISSDKEWNFSTLAIVPVHAWDGVIVYDGHA
jgi:hypothetical protein